MSDVEAQDRKEESPAPKLLRPTFSPWFTVIAMAAQAILCALTWSFVGLMIVRTLPLHDDLANWVHNNPSDTNMMITIISTVLALIGSSLLGITVQQALLFRLPRGVPLSLVAPWVQIARNSLFLRFRSHMWWTLLSLLWLIVTHLQTTAWSNLLTPVTVVRNFAVSGQDIDFLNPATATYFVQHTNFPFIPPGTRNFTLNPESISFLADNVGYLTQGGRSATSDYLQPGYPSFVGQFNSSTGGVNPASPQVQLSNIPLMSGNYQGLSTSFSLVQQGYTADISCKTSSSPTITLNNSASGEHVFQSPSGAFNYSLETWSWGTTCLGTGEFYTGEVNLLTSGSGLIGNGLFATSVCLNQNFTGPSNQSFLLIMQSPSGSGYNTSYFAANPNLPVVCQVTPMVTRLEVQYNQTGLNNVNSVLEQALTPDDAWILSSIEGTVIWGLYFIAQGPYSNSLADEPIEVVSLVTGQALNGDFLPIAEQYLRGVFEYMGSVMRGSVFSRYAILGQPVPVNITTPITGTMNVQTIGWSFHPRTHSIAVAVIMLITAATLISGSIALLEANQAMLLHRQSTATAHVFNPTNLIDFLLASSMGSLADKLSRCEDEAEREKLKIGLAVTAEGRCVLDARS